MTQHGKRVDYDTEYYCGNCGTSFKHGEEKFRKIFGVLIPIPPRNNGNASCPDCGCVLRSIPRTTVKTGVYRL